MSEIRGHCLSLILMFNSHINKYVFTSGEAPALWSCETLPDLSGVQSLLLLLAVLSLMKWDLLPYSAVPKYLGAYVPMCCQWLLRIFLLYEVCVLARSTDIDLLNWTGRVASLPNGPILCFVSARTSVPTASILLRMMVRLTQISPPWIPTSPFTSLASALWRWLKSTPLLAWQQNSRSLSECEYGREPCHRLHVLSLPYFPSSERSRAELPCLCGPLEACCRGRAGKRGRQHRAVSLWWWAESAGLGEPLCVWSVWETGNHCTLFLSSGGRSYFTRSLITSATS